MSFSYLFQQMRSTDNLSQYIAKILQDESLQREWDNLCNTSSLNLGSDTDTYFMASKGSSENSLSRYLKKARFSFDLQESVVMGGKKQVLDLSYYKEKTQQMIQINYCYRQKIAQIKNALIQAVSFMQEKFTKDFKDFECFSGYVEDCPLEETFNMAIYLRNSLQKATANEQISQIQEKINILKAQNRILTQNYESLINYVEERKKYSEGLKLRITKLKDEVKEVAQREQKFRAVLEGLQNLDQELDFKYRNRNDLIAMIKSLLARIIKHNKECLGSQDPEPLLSMNFLGKIVLKSSSPGSKGRQRR